MPSRYTCEGENISPPLEWADAPVETKSFALFMEDMDAPKGVFRHWALYDIMPDRVLLPEGVRHGVKTESMGHGVNDYGHPPLRRSMPTGERWDASLPLSVGRAQRRDADQCAEGTSCRSMGRRSAVHPGASGTDRCVREPAIDGVHGSVGRVYRNGAPKGNSRSAQNPCNYGTPGRYSGCLSVIA